MPPQPPFCLAQQAHLGSLSDPQIILHLRPLTLNHGQNSSTVSKPRVKVKILRKGEEECIGECGRKTLFAII